MVSNHRSLSSYYRRTATVSYSTLAISEGAWTEILDRLKKAGVHEEYLDNNKIIFGDAALIKEPTNI